MAMVEQVDEVNDAPYSERDDDLNEICREYQLKRYSSAGRVIEKVREQISKDLQFGRGVEKLGLVTAKSQTKAPLLLTSMMEFG